LSDALPRLVVLALSLPSSRERQKGIV